MGGKVILKAGCLAILQDDSKYSVASGYKPDGTFDSRTDVRNINEAASLFCDLFSLRVIRWARKISEKEKKDIENSVGT